MKHARDYPVQAEVRFLAMCAFCQAIVQEIYTVSSGETVPYMHGLQSWVKLPDNRLLCPGHRLQVWVDNMLVQEILPEVSL